MLSITGILLVIYFIKISMAINQLQVRNSFLRIVIANDYKKTKNVVTSIKKYFYNKTLTTYYNISEKYYALSEDDKTLIEAIISLGY